MPVSSVLIGVDLAPIRAVGNSVTIQGDITTQKCRAEIKKALHGWKVDAVLHDGAPNVGAAWLQDAFTQSELVLSSLKLATEFLRGGGSFITKIFRSNDYNSLIWVFNQLFTKVEATKPQASRNTSAEIFVVCQGYLEPTSIDPKLLDPKYVFKEVDEKYTTGHTIFSRKQPKRAPRVGYEETNGLLYKSAPVIDFIDCDDPITMLSEYHQYVWDDQSMMFKSHKETDKEVLTLLEDLKVLGKTDFKRLLKWRTAMKKYKNTVENEDNMEEDNDEEEEEMDNTPKILTEEEEEEKITLELENRVNELAQKKKRETRKLLKKKRKVNQKLQLKMILPSDQFEMPQDEETFQLDTIPDDSHLDKLMNTNPDVTINQADNSSDDEDEEDDEAIDSNEEDDDDDEDQDDYATRQEEYFDAMYDEYLEKSKNGKKKRKHLEEQEEEEEENEEYNRDDENVDEDVTGYVPRVSGNIDSDSEDDNTSNKKKKNSLIVNNDEDKKSIRPSKRADMWFSQFKGLQDDLDEDSELQKLKDKVLNKDKSEEKISKTNNKKRKAEDSADEDSDDDDEENDKKSKRKEEQFEEVPKKIVTDHDDEDEEDELDEDAKAEILALGGKLINNPNLKQEYIDNLYNRYAFNDFDLPQWFKDDESRHNRPIQPITKSEIDAIKVRLAELNARPIKKVAEAKARKRMQLMKKMEKAKSVAEAISKNEEISNADKMKAIEKIYKKTKKGQKKKTVVVINQKCGGRLAHGQSRTKSSRLKLVDSRMKKDLRATKAKSKKKR